MNPILAATPMNATADIEQAACRAEFERFAVCMRLGFVSVLSLCTVMLVLLG